MSLSANPRKKTTRSRRKAATLEEPTAVEHLNFSTNAANDDVVLNAWTAVDLDPDDMWSPPIGAAPMAAKCRVPTVPSCVLDSSQLAAFAGSARDDVSDSERCGILRRSNSSFSEWPESYSKLGEPARFTMNKPEPISFIASKDDDDGDGSLFDARSVLSNMSSNVPRSRTSSISSFSMTPSIMDFNVKAPRQKSGSMNFSDTSSYTVSTGLSIGPLLSSHGMQSRGADVMVNEQAILKASLPAGIGGRYGRYVIALARTTLKQAFGLEFFTAETRERTLSGIFVSNDMPHLGIGRWDKLLSVNGTEPKTAQECQARLKQELLLVLVLQSRNSTATEPVQKPDMKSLPLRDQNLLTIKKDLLEGTASDFKLRISRRSPTLSLDLPFVAKSSKSENQGPLLATRDMPHLEILAGDQLLSLNGIRSLAPKVLAHIMNSAHALDLRLRRHVAVGKPPPSEQLGTYEEPNSLGFQEKAGGREVRERQYLCCMPEARKESLEFVPAMAWNHSD